MIELMQRIIFDTFIIYKLSSSSRCLLQEHYYLPTVTSAATPRVPSLSYRMPRILCDNFHDGRVQGPLILALGLIISCLHWLVMLLVYAPRS